MAKVKCPMTTTEALCEAIKIVGGQAAMARALGISKQAIQFWKITPVHHVLKIEKMTGIPRRQLRPDIYPD